MKPITLFEIENHFALLYRQKIATDLGLDLDKIPNLSGHKFSETRKTIKFYDIKFSNEDTEYYIESPQVWLNLSGQKRITKDEMLNYYNKLDINFFMDIEKINIIERDKDNHELDLQIEKHNINILTNSSKTWYHGTNKNFEKFDINKFGQNEPKGDYVGKSIYFSDCPEVASRYGKHIFEVELSIKNPLIISNSFNYDDFIKDIAISDNVPNSLRFSDSTARMVTWIKHTSQEERAKYTKEKGFDSLLDLKYRQASVFSEDQITIIKKPLYKKKNTQKL